MLGAPNLLQRTALAQPIEVVVQGLFAAQAGLDQTAAEMPDIALT